MTTTRELWENALTDLELTIPKAAFNTWFRDTHIVRVEEGVVFVGVPSQFIRDWFATKYHKLILASLRRLSENVRSVEYIISKHPKKVAEEVKPASSLGELPLESVHSQTNLNPRYTFDSFIVGPFNELAHAAAQAVSKKPGIAYNPLFVYGEPGLGKTHLIQAIGNYTRMQAPERKTFYITSEKFYLEYVAAMQTGHIPAFKEKYRAYDLLVMDDIQFLSGKSATQEELFHLFNALFDKNRQLVFSSDQHPNLIQKLVERLKSRFNQGMVVSITPPDHESRVAIIRAKAAARGTTLPDDISDHVASTVNGNVRELEGAVNTLLLSLEMRNSPLTVSDAKELLRAAAAPQKSISIPEVVKMIAEFYNIQENDIYEKTRRKEVVRPRQVVMYILREDFKISFPTIGEKLGGRDHTTVIHSCEKIKTDTQTDGQLIQEIQQIRNMLR
ncbi:MAG TPA: chromosomal replication initiator protein DnaA [Candidatus Paceibacterota bacterium]